MARRVLEGAAQLSRDQVRVAACVCSLSTYICFVPRSLAWCELYMNIAHIIRRFDAAPTGMWALMMSKR